MAVSLLFVSLIKSWWRFSRKSDRRRPRECIYCGGREKIWFNGRRFRSATVLWGRGVRFVRKIPCRRVKCSRCRRSWTLRPPGLIGHWHYQLCAVASALEQGLFEGSKIDAVAIRLGTCRRSIQRWRDWLAAVVSPEFLMMMILEASDAPVLVALPPVQGLERIRAATGQETAKRAGRNLALLEALGAARSLEPPGLRGVLERVSGDRAGIVCQRRTPIPEGAWGEMRRMSPS